MKYKVSPDMQMQAFYACVRYLQIFTQAHSLLAVQHFFSAGSKTTPVVVHLRVSSLGVGLEREKTRRAEG